MLRQCSEYHKSYADILYSWQLLNQRAEILKFQVTRTLDTVQQQIGFANICKVCGEKVQGPSCIKSHCYAFTCSICNLSVKGMWPLISNWLGNFLRGGKYKMLSTVYL